METIQESIKVTMVELIFYVYITVRYFLFFNLYLYLYPHIKVEAKRVNR